MSASCCGLARLHVGVVALACFVAGVAAAWLFEVNSSSTARGGKTVEVVVAAKDLQLGTKFTWENVNELTTTKSLPRDALPRDYVASREELIDKRLYRLARQGEFLAAADVKGRQHVALRSDRELVTIPVTDGLQNAFVGPGCLVDVIAVFNDDSRREVFTLVPDVHVIDVNTQPNASRGGGTPMSFAFDEKQTLLIDTAQRANCTFELLLRHPDSPRRDFDHDRTLSRVKGLLKQPKPEPVVAPAPRAKQIVSIPKPFWGGSVTPGSTVDILAVSGEGKRREVFTLLPDMQVLAVSETHDASAKQGFLDVAMVSFAVSEREALLLALATEHDCYLELVPRRPGAPKRDFDYEQTLARVQRLAKKPDAENPIAPIPRAKN